MRHHALHHVREWVKLAAVRIGDDVLYMQCLMFGLFICCVQYKANLLTSSDVNVTRSGSHGEPCKQAALDKFVGILTHDFSAREKCWAFEVMYS